MGITVWTLRGESAGEYQIQADPSEERPRLDSPPRSNPQAQPEATGRVEPATHRFVIHALCVPGVVLLSDAITRQNRTLFFDLLRAAASDWQATPAALEFSWPIPGASGDAGPALNAFVDKQVSDFAARLVLATESARDHLGAGAISTETVPDFSQSGQPESKLELWRRIQNGWS
jgi:hypothetical protein|tara:strand:- start:3077 stop:3601 length:525 start_codon:yes stop_codon:yes gene_type:complete